MRTSATTIAKILLIPFFAPAGASGVISISELGSAMFSLPSASSRFRGKSDKGGPHKAFVVHGTNPWGFGRPFLMEKKRVGTCAHAGKGYYNRHRFRGPSLVVSWRSNRHPRPRRPRPPRA